MQWFYSICEGWNWLFWAFEVLEINNNYNFLILVKDSKINKHTFAFIKCYLETHFVQIKDFFQKKIFACGHFNLVLGLPFLSVMGRGHEYFKTTYSLLVMVDGFKNNKIIFGYC